MQDKRYFTVSILVCVLFVLIAAFALKLTVIEQPSSDNTFAIPSQKTIRDYSHSEGLEFWRNFIIHKGGKEAYNHFSTVFSATDPNLQHDKAHTFGEALYKELGTDGVVICDSNFGFGCFHSFFGWAVSLEGMDSIYDLDSKCVERYGIKGLGCTHGIGHGILTKLGYDKLNEALTLCSELQWQGPIGGCTSGVFMEYNFQTMLERQIRKVDDQGLHHPCTEVDDEFTESCYFEQTNWWVLNPEIRKEEVADLCKEIEDKKDRTACFRGFGNTLATSNNFQSEYVYSNCKKISTRENELLCIEGAAWIISFQEPYYSEYITLCEYYEETEKERCLKSTDLI